MFLYSQFVIWMTYFVISMSCSRFAFCWWVGKYLRNSNARIRAKAADVITTVVQNNPTSQQLVMEASGFEPLLSNFRSDPDLTARIKALGALSCKYFVHIFRWPQYILYPIN